MTILHSIIAEAAHHHEEGVGWFSEYRELLQSGGHWAFELTVEACSTAVGLIVGLKFWRRWTHKHDVEVHGVECEEHDSH